jgi:DNA-binding PadR family transcriptional regulator
VEHGSLYPAPHRLEKHVSITSKWSGRRAAATCGCTGSRRRRRRQLKVEETNWEQLVRAMAKMLKPV